MPPRPFPHPWHVGTDICKIARIRKLITRDNTIDSLQPLSRFLRRLLTPPERVYFWHRFGPEQAVHNKRDVVSQFLAGRFAAKEACRKACPQLHPNDRGFQQIVILPVAPTPQQHLDPHQSLRPQGLILDAVVREGGSSSVNGMESSGHTENASNSNNILDTLQGQLCEVSISHDSEYATAVALVPAIDRER